VHDLYFNPLSDEEHFNVPQNLTSLPFWFTVYILVGTQNDQPASRSPPADRFAS